MSAMWIGRFERFSPERCNASLSIERMSPTSSRRLASSRSRYPSSSRIESPAWFLPGLLRGGGGGGMIVDVDATLEDLPFADLPFTDLPLPTFAWALVITIFAGGVTLAGVLFMAERL